METKITEKDLLTDFESIKEDLKKYSVDDPAIKEYDKEMEGLKEKEPFFVVPASFIYTISSC
ncbi:MAG: hypothetical protein A3D97_02450 [Nitrospinae bacterium RIFCSPHIGHO2_12_FULL_39_42]|nr:MAG: hypothetical protein A3D97_02450 [Nitrospinae bacterium RIFCSPHIGHO2_12_FULL_39_42]